MEAEIGYEFRKITGERQARAYAIRKSRQVIERRMTNAMRDAEFEIERAFNILAGHLGYVTLDPLYVRGKNDSDPDGEWQQIQIQKYNEWFKNCPRLDKAITLDFILGTTAKDISDQRGMKTSIVINHFLEGLNLYCVQQGWGEQINS